MRNRVTIPTCSGNRQRPPKLGVPSLAAEPSAARVQSVDALRGVVMIIMALDHVREFFHSGAMLFQPEDLTRTITALFLTRWITHFCAPVFALTAGLGAYLWSSRGRSQRDLPMFLFKRGLWLVLLDLTVLRFAMFFSLTSDLVILSVLWMLGWSLAILGLLARFPIRVLFPVSIAVIVFHNMADPVKASAFGWFGPIWNILHQPALIPLKHVMVLVSYPLVPWSAVVAAGFCLGSLFRLAADSRRRCLWALGTGLTLGFVGLRLLNVYGDPQPWSVQPTQVSSILSFLRTTKYPPSLAFLLMTLGPAMILWAGLEKVRLSSSNPIIVFGRVPLFYFLGHFIVAHALSYPLAMIRYGTVDFLKHTLPTLGGSLELYPPNYGYDLPTVYLLWILVLALMYPPCLLLANLKQRRRDWWLSYL